MHDQEQTRIPGAPVDDAEILIVDDEKAVRELVSHYLTYLGYRCRLAENGDQALEIAKHDPRPSVTLMDIDMPGSSGVATLNRIKELDPYMQVVMVSGVQDLKTVRHCLREGAYDYVVKPFELEDLGLTVARAQERNRLLRQNEEYQQNLERMVEEQTEEIRQTRDLALFTLAKLAESRDTETGLHLDRIAAYSRHLALLLRETPYAPQIRDEFVEQIFKSSPLHDIGKVGVPDSILLKTGPLTPDEMKTMQKHTTIGGDTLRSVVRRYRGHTFLTVAMQIAYNHHERWDGSGYPKGLAGEEIPLEARIVALVDAYDAITSWRPYKDAYDHDEAVRRIQVDRGKHFDPVLVDCYSAHHQEFADIQAKLKKEEADHHNL